jgi:hypothetical protein
MMKSCCGDKISPCCPAFDFPRGREAGHSQSCQGPKQQIPKK